eukprot:6650967-Alexandrium_andersonii.AAC.1
MASFVLARQQLQSSTRQKDEEDLYTVGVEINLNHFAKNLFDGTVHIFNRLYIDQSLAFYNTPVPATRVTSRVKVQTAYVENVYSNLRQHGYFVDFQLLGFNKQKNLY